MNFLRRIQPILGVGIALALAWSAWVFTGRFFEHKKLAQQAARKTTPAPPGYERIYSGDTLKILQFYAREGELTREQKTLLCYSVMNADSVRMEPPVAELGPSLNRCVEIAPRKTTIYTLIAEGAGGAKAQQTVTVRVNSR